MRRSYRVPKLQSLWRILVIPWLMALATVGSLSSSEDYAGAQFIGWLDFSKQTEFHNQVHLVGSVPYEVLIFTQMRPPYATLERAMSVRAHIVITDAQGKEVRQFSDMGYAWGAPMDRQVGADMLGAHTNELVDDHATDPYNREKIYQNTSIFKVAKTGEYRITTLIEYHPPAWRIGLLLNAHATSKWYYWLEITLLYLPFFIGQEIYYLIKLRKWRTWPAYWRQFGKDVLKDLRDKRQNGKDPRK